MVVSVSVIIRRVLSNQKSSSWRKVSKLSSVTTLLHGVHSSDDENERKRRKERVAEQLEKNYYYDDGVAKWPIVYPIANSGRRQVGSLQGVPSELRLGFVDLDFEGSTVCPTLLGLMGIWQKRLGSWARWWNTEIKVNPTQVSSSLGTPCMAHNPLACFLHLYSWRSEARSFR